MSERPHLSLAALQHADSMFPSGAISFSWGLESLFNRRTVTGRAGVAAFMTAQLCGRWATLDRAMLVHASQADNNLDRLTRLDALVEAQSLSAEQRLGSKRMGAALLTVHNRLGTKLAAEVLGLVNSGAMYGHIPVVQGVMWSNLGIATGQMQIMSAHGLCTGFLGAAVRLSIIGHLDAQGIYGDLLPLIEHILRESVCDPDETHSFIPQIEIAAMNHETDEMRLFGN